MQPVTFETSTTVSISRETMECILPARGTLSKELNLIMREACSHFLMRTFPIRRTSRHPSSKARCLQSLVYHQPDLGVSVACGDIDPSHLRLDELAYARTDMCHRSGPLRFWLTVQS